MENVKSEGCGPGCDCGKTPGNTKAKAVICLVVLLAVCGVLIYRTKNAGQGTPANTETAFASPIVSQAAGQEPAVKSVEGQKTAGEFLDSLAALNKVAVNQDAVFVFVPANENETISKETINAIASAEQKLESNGVRIGLYTLRFSPSKEYASIASQITLPGMLVMTKGRGMGAVSGEITETKLLQAYVASSRAGGCCPAGGSTVCK